MFIKSRNWYMHMDAHIDTHMHDQPEDKSRHIQMNIDSLHCGLGWFRTKKAHLRTHTLWTQNSRHRRARSRSSSWCSSPPFYPARPSPWSNGMTRTCRWCVQSAQVRKPASTWSTCPAFPACSLPTIACRAYRIALICSALKHDFRKETESNALV